MAGAPPQLPSRTPGTFTRRAFLAGLGASAGLALYSNDLARHELDITQRTFYLPRLPPAFDGFRIVQFSDIHLEEFTEDFFLRHVVAQVNALDADLVLVTGDFVSRGPFDYHLSYAAAARCGQLLAALTCPQRYGILGNHDAMVGPTLVTSHMEDNGLPILGNKRVRIERGGEYFWLAGVDDVSSGYPNLMEAIPDRPDAPVLLMAHEPDFFDSLITHTRGRYVDLMLSGHTHGGQVRLPGLKPLLLPPLGRRYPEGHYRCGATQLYVNRGVGTVGVPFRLNCPPEITVLTLRPLERNG